MDSEHLKQMYGDEYPAAVRVFGMRMPLSRERRFSRCYTNKEHNHETEVSRFADGSASISLDQLKQEWPNWPEDDRMDFCGACTWLHGQPQFPDMLRFIIATGNHTHWSSIANALPHALPREEAFQLPRNVLKETPCNSANITQAIVATKHPKAETLLRDHLAEPWSKSDLWPDDPFLNWTAFDATCCIAHLLDLGTVPSDFETQAQALVQHVCEGNRRSCGTFLHQYYNWIPLPEVPQFGP
jgi:hypothetical protein